MPQISIIVPVYKVENFIGDCIKSILNQSFQDFELILVDDGSPDNSLSVCTEYSKIDNRIRVLQKQNGGVSSARNYGIQHSRGTWICFVDSDDTIYPTYLQELVCGVEGNNDVSLAIAGYRNVDNDGKLISIHSFPNTEITSDIPKALSYAELFNIINSPVCKLFRRDIVQDHNLKFSLELSYGEDHIFVLEYVKYIATIYISTEIVYNYYHRFNGSLSSSILDPKKMITYVEKVSKYYQDLNKKFCSDYYCETINHQLSLHIIRATYFLMISSIKNKREQFIRLYSISQTVQTKIHLSVFYDFIWKSYQYPEKIAFYLVYLLSRIKKIIA